MALIGSFWIHFFLKLSKRWFDFLRTHQGFPEGGGISGDISKSPVDRSSHDGTQPLPVASGAEGEMSIPLKIWFGVNIILNPMATDVWVRLRARVSLFLATHAHRLHQP